MRFNVLDHLLLSGALFDMCVYNAFVLHEPDNTSDHDPLVMRLSLDVRYMSVSNRSFTKRVVVVVAAAVDL